MRFRVPLVVAAGLTLVVRTPAAAGVRIATAPAEARLDQSVVVRVTGLRAGLEVTVRSSTPDEDERAWRAEASFRADAKGVVDLSTQAPTGGSYAGVDGMGLFWSARPEAPSATPFPRPAEGHLETTLEAVVEGRVVATTTLVRTITTVEVSVTDVKEDGLVGRLYQPSGTRHPAVLVLGGDGGIPPAFASVLAGHGYVAFALAYFGAEGLPRDIVEIPLAYFRNGIEWLRARPSVDPEKVAVVGLSEGAELSLLLGSSWPDLKAVVALAPSSVVWEGAVPGRSPWSLEGRPLPFLPRAIPPDRISALEAPAAADAAIAVEKIGGAVLLLSSRDDGVWPAATMGERVVERLRAKGFAHRYEHIRYDACSHVLPDAWLPPAWGGALGGTAEGTMRAYADYWPKLLAFLDREVGPRPAGRR